MASRYGLEEDDRELNDEPMLVACDQCGEVFRWTEDDIKEDDVLLCLKCANARARAARRSA